MKTKQSLPYLNNVSAILITLLINLILMCLINWQKPFTLSDVLIDGLICGVLTSAINVFLVVYLLRKRQFDQGFAENLPSSRLMMMLPKNPYLFASFCALFFGILTPLLNGLIFKFYDFERLNFYQMLVLKLLYTTFLSAKILELVVFRFLQPDVISKFTHLTADPQAIADIKIPIPHISYFQELYKSWITDFGTNMAIGLLLGGTIITDTDYVMIAPTLLNSMIVSGPISGMIITFMVIPPIAGSILTGMQNGTITAVEKPHPWLKHLPATPWLLALALCFPIILLTTIVYTLILSFFDFQSLNFFQFFFIRTAYTAVLVKGLVKLILLRYRQPD